MGLWDILPQEHTSALTSINSQKIPALFSRVDRHVGWKRDTSNLDLGSGQYLNVVDWLWKKDVFNTGYDPYNLSSYANSLTIDYINRNKVDTVSISNVLNVIKEPENRLLVLLQAKAYVRDDGHIYITVYTKNRNNKPEVTVKGYQSNRSLKSYLEEVARVFPSAYIKHNLLII